MIRGYRYRYVLIRDLFCRPFPSLIDRYKELFGTVSYSLTRLKAYQVGECTYVLRVTLEKLDSRLTTMAFQRGIVIERISGTMNGLGLSKDRWEEIV